MRVRVVGDLVAGLGDRADQRGMSDGIFADKEKRGTSLVRGEEHEDARGILGIRAIVDRKPDLAGGRGETLMHAEETLGVGKEKMIGEQRVGHEPECEGRTERGAADEDGGDFAG
jgi:hypothetical protein